jgi:hypothetical protein
MSVVQISPSAVAISPDWMRRRAPELARDIVCQLDTAANLAKAYGLSDTQWLVLKVWPAFIQMVKDANEELGGSAGVTERARRKAALAIAEVGVQDMATIMGDPKANARDRIAAFDQLKDVAVMGAKQQVAAASAAGTGSAGGFLGPLIQINMPNGASLSIGEVEPIANHLPVIEGEATKVEGA